MHLCFAGLFTILCARSSYALTGPGDWDVATVTAAVMFGYFALFHFGLLMVTRWARQIAAEAARSSRLGTSHLECHPARVP